MYLIKENPGEVRLFAVCSFFSQRLDNFLLQMYRIDKVRSSRILEAKQKLGVTFNFDKQDVIDFMKFSKMTMCRASEAKSEK